MKIIHKSALVEAHRFDPDTMPWPKGVVKVSDQNGIWFELRAMKWGKGQPLAPGDYIVTPEFNDTNGEMLDVEQALATRYVMSAAHVAAEYITLGEVDTQ